MWRNTERANLKKKPSMILSQDPWVGVKVKVKPAIGCAAQPTRGLTQDMSGMVVKGDFDRGFRRAGGVEDFQKLDKFAGTPGRQGCRFTIPYRLKLKEVST
jgi:hypothetical protein